MLSNEIKMNDDEFELMRNFINSKTGLFYNQNKKYLLEKRLSYRLNSLNLKNYIEYHEYLTQNFNKNKELENIIDLLTTNETFFFREFKQIELLIYNIIPEFIANGKRKIKIWSSASSSGEEPYTIAMALYEKGMFDKINIEINATDISNEILDKARKAEYTDFSFRQISELYKNKYFENKRGKYHLDPKIKRLVKFSKVNLLEDFSNKFREIDVLYCRNVLIYFEKIVKEKIVNNFGKVLSADGTLFLGHSETLFGLKTDFQIKKFNNSIGYIKK